MTLVKEAKVGDPSTMLDFFGIELDMIDLVMQVWHSLSKLYPGEEAALGVVFKVVLPRFQFQRLNM